MQANSPHYLLLSEASTHADDRHHWRFVLRSVAGDQSFAAADDEPGTDRGRLELLAVVRGLEALDQPSRVTLLTRSRYVSRGIRRGLSQWRERGWQWERFGELVPVRDHDLWRRLDRALRIHEVECCWWQWDEPEQPRRVATTAAATGGRSAAGTRFAPQSEGRAAAAACSSVGGDSVADYSLPTRLHRGIGDRVASHSQTGPRRPAFSRALVRLGQAVSASLAAICRPALDRAA